MTQAAVVVGAGPLGVAVTEELLRRGETPVRLVNRSGRVGDAPGGLEVRAADVHDPAAIDAALSGASVVFQCAQPAYTRWPQEFPALQRAVLDAAARAGARAVVADNLYAYGPVSRPLREDLPAAAADAKGRTRAEMAAEALARTDLPVAIGRASDFFGPRVTESMLGDRVFGRVVAGKAAQVLGNPDLPHTYTFIGDFARGLVTLAHADRAYGAAWHVPSAPTVTTREIISLAAEPAGQSTARVQVMPGWMLMLASLASADLREVRATQYQRTAPYVVDHAKFAAAFGETVTPHVDAIAATVAWYAKAAADGHAR